MIGRALSRRATAALAAAAALALLAGAGSSLAGESEPAPNGERFQVLVYSHTAGFRHLSIPQGIAAIQELGEENDFGVVATEDPTQFNGRNLRRFEAVIFLLTTGDTLPEKRQQRALRRYIKRRGGGYVGIHSAADTEHDWPFYGRLVGAYFKSHPIQQMAEFVNEAPRNPATAHLKERFEVFDEFYSFKSNPRAEVKVLLTIDEETYDPDPNTTDLPGDPPPSSGVMGDHPMAWCHKNLGPPSFYTALGHEGYLYEQDWFRQHVLGGIEIATEQVKRRCKPPQAG